MYNNDYLRHGIVIEVTIGQLFSSLQNYLCEKIFFKNTLWTGCLSVLTFCFSFLCLFLFWSSSLTRIWPVSFPSSAYFSYFLSHTQLAQSVLPSFFILFPLLQISSLGSSQILTGSGSTLSLPLSILVLLLFLIVSFLYSLCLFACNEMWIQVTAKHCTVVNK